MFEDILWQLRQNGLSVSPNFLSPEQIVALQQEVLRQWQEDGFKKAGVGHGDNFEVNHEIRNDFILWLAPPAVAPAIAQYLLLLEQLRLAINQELLLGLFDFEGMMAVYPEGHYYKKHTDQFQDTDLRTLTAILYLNPDWQEIDGGQLRVYFDAYDESHYRDIAPQAGTLVTFLSSQYPHEVLPARRERISITGWFRRRDPNAIF